MKKNYKKTNQQEFRIEKVIKIKGDKLYVKWKGYVSLFNRWVDKKNLVLSYCIKVNQYFPKPNEPFGEDINVKVDLSNYATKAGIKNISHVDTSSFALKSNLASLKTYVDKLDIDKLVPVPVDLSKLSDVVKNDVIKKTAKKKDKLVAKVNNINTGRFVLKTKYDTDYGKIPYVSSLATKTALTTVKNKIPDVSSLVKKRHNNKLQKLKINLIVIIKIHVLLLQSLIL